MRLLLLALLPLAGCSMMPMLPEPMIVFQEVKVEVQRPCQVMVDPQPDYPDSVVNLLAASGHIDQQVDLLLKARALRAPYEAELLAALNSCIKE